jgi:hypothetical protein
VFGLDLSHWSEGAGGAKPIDFYLQIDGAKGLLEIFRPDLEESLGAPVALGNRRGWEIPLPPAFGQLDVKAVVLFDEIGRLTVASRSAYLSFVESDSMKLAEEKDFRSATDQFPAAGNLLLYGSKQLPPVIAELIRGNAAAIDEDNAPLIAKLCDYLQPSTAAFCISYEPDGIATMSELPFPTDVPVTTALPMLSATSVMFVGARAWKRGSDRAGCIMNIRNVQQATRSYQNMNGLKIGDPLPLARIIGPGQFIETNPRCPAGGAYTFSKKIPEIGDLACECEHAQSENHTPASHGDW